MCNPLCIIFAIQRFAFSPLHPICVLSSSFPSHSLTPFCSLLLPCLLGVLSDILNYVLQQDGRTQPKGGTAEDVDNSHVNISQVYTEEVCMECFCFLRVFAHQNPEVQQRLYDRMDDLLSIKVAVPYMAMVLTEMFSGNLEIALRVKEKQVEKIFQLISEGVDGQPELLEILQSMASVRYREEQKGKGRERVIVFCSLLRLEI